MDTTEIRSKAAAMMPQVMDDLGVLVGNASCAFPGFPPEPVNAARATVIDILKRSGFSAGELDLEGGGYPAVWGELPAPAGAPTVLLYGHYDVQPAPMEQGWTTDPWTLTKKDDGRYYGRGAADDKSGVAIHAGTLRVFDGKPPVGIKLILEGEEETLSHLEDYVAKHPERFKADVMIIADMGNIECGEPVLTTMLRGHVQCIVEVDTAKKCKLSSLGAFALFAFLICASSAHGEGESQASQEGTLASESNLEAEGGSEASEGKQGPEAETEPDAEDLFLQTLRLDISTASLTELAAWCRSLGLPDSGSKEELASRLTGYFKISVEPKAEADKKRLISIESARDTEYFTLEANEEKYVKLSGGVIVTMRDDEKGETHKIEAEEITFNQTQNTLSAKGKVVYTLTKPDGIDYFIGESLTVDLDTWKGDFLDGMNKKSLGDDKDSSNFTFAADRIMKSEGSVVVFQNGVITSCTDEEPHFAIRANKVWILGANEWAIQDAILTVGNIPVLYLPFFYYPSEEIVFHPVLGYKERVGRFVQTTTYILGEKPAETEKLTIFQLAKSSQAFEREIRGLFYRTTDRKKGTGSKDTLKVMADFYANLGMYAAVEAHIPARESIPKIDATISLARSRNVYVKNSFSTPFDPDDNFKDTWNDSTLLGLTVPFRYGVDLSSSITFESLTMSLQFPFYSDPYLDRDFKDRTENMKWLSFLEETSPAATSSSSEKSQAAMKFDLSYSPTIPAIAPYIQSIGINSASTSLVWNVKQATKEGGGPYADVDPRYKFFYPYQLSILNAAFSIRGNLFSWPIKQSAQIQKKGLETPQSEGTEKGKDDKEPVSLDEARIPWTQEGKQEETKKDPSQGGGDLEAFKSPERAKDIQTVTQMVVERKPFTFDLSYTASPTIGAESRFDFADWKKSEDIDMALLYTLLTTRLSGSTNFTGALYESIFTFSGAFNFNTQFEVHPYINTDSASNTPSIVQGYAMEDYKYRTDKITGSLKLGSSPFTDLALFKRSSFQYGMEAILYKNEFASLVGTTPSFKSAAFEFTTNAITAHNFGFTFSLSQDSVQVPSLPGPGSQAAQTLSVNPGSGSLTLTANLPPLTTSFSGTLSLDVWLAKLQGSSRIYQKANDSSWYYDPLTITSSAVLPWDLRLSDTFSFNLQYQYPISNSLALSYGNFSSAFSMKRSKDYFLNQTSSGWQVVPGSAETFKASDISIYYKNTTKPEPMWENRINFLSDISTSLSMNLIRPTETVFTFTLALTLKVNKFLDLTFSSMSQNTSMYMYLIGLPGFDSVFLKTIGWRNPMEDLVKSFNFFYEPDRIDSKFKLKSLSIKATHDLEDWDLSIEYTGRPEKKLKAGSTNKYVYVFNSYFSIYLKWKTIPEIKSTVQYQPSGITLK